MSAETWFRAWPDRIEPVEIDFASPAPGSRGPFPTREQAEEARYRDTVPDYWEVGLSVIARHCPGCGAFAKVLAGDDEGMGWAWAVTECKKCGVIDQRREA